MKYTYRELTTKDVHLFLDLLCVFGRAFEDEQAYQSNVPSTEYLQVFLSKPHVVVLVALDKEMVVGGLVAYELEKFEQARKELYIYDLAVLETHRRKGIATALILQLKKIAKKRGAYIIYVQADQADAPAIALYESLGTKESVLHFDISPDS